ncbi:uncharacterized protein LOC115571232 [Sparus aurata]|uniref:uncharacterized protein LOC115571232 n=1 Tax=Sparus aurata TaxID=8175 RepID=UPI0011C1A390|nr:uncharacterized protein LOC115571232 [Sparus aurata]
MDDFKMLIDSLDKEKMTRRAALREEAKLKIRMIHLISEMTEITCPLSDTIVAIDKFGSDERFIVTCATEMKSIQSALRNLWTISQEDMNVSKHVENLPLAVLEKMSNNIKQTSVVVNSKTASSCPSVSDHPTEVNDNDTQQPCPEYPECSTSYQQNLQKSPKRRRVEQDYDNGKVSFHDPDNKTAILTLTQSPVINLGDEVEAEQGRAETFREEGAHI